MFWAALVFFFLPLPRTETNQFASPAWHAQMSRFPDDDLGVTDPLTLSDKRR